MFAGRDKKERKDEGVVKIYENINMYLHKVAFSLVDGFEIEQKFFAPPLWKSYFA